MKPLPLYLSALTAATLALAGCSDDKEASQAPPSPGETVIEEDSGLENTQEPVPEWDTVSKREAINAARDALVAFARPDLDQKTWYSELEPYLTENAAQTHHYTDPENITASEVTGPGDIIDDESAYLAVVSVPTDDGDYQVTVVRDNAEADWLVEKIEAPEGTR